MKRFLILSLTLFVLSSCEEDTPEPEQEEQIHCYDGQLNSDEEAIDCGGTDCAPCNEISLCGDGNLNGYETATDCYNGMDGLSACPHCSTFCGDGLWNGLEEAEDCGGDCLPCNDPIFCGDGVQNGYEDGIDCYNGFDGLSSCPDCASLCGDGIQNGLEQAVDCGGDCIPCNDISLCGDGIQNGAESGVDCYDGFDGLSACPPCQILCGDGEFNGYETDTDCGGSDCGPCGIEETGFLKYEVNGQLYETNFWSLVVQRFIGSDSNPDRIFIGGGLAHNLTLSINDSDLIPNTFNTGEYIAPPGQLLGETVVQLNEPFPVPIQYTSWSDSQGISIEVVQVDFTAPIFPDNQGGLVEILFSGSLSDSSSGESVTIQNGHAYGYFSN